MNDMARGSNGNRHLADAIALMVQNQAALLAELAEQTRFVSELRETNRTFEVIKRDLDQIKAILLRHERILTELPEIIRQKIGFKAK
jgi:hypothetical protein